MDFIEDMRELNHYIYDFYNENDFDNQKKIIHLLAEKVPIMLVYFLVRAIISGNIDHIQLIMIETEFPDLILTQSVISQEISEKERLQYVDLIFNAVNSSRYKTDISFLFDNYYEIYVDSKEFTGDLYVPSQEYIAHIHFSS